MLLTRVEITDYLSIKGNLSIDLDKNVSILLGPNDHGKSNILKALLHLNDDAPLTDDEANWDATDEAGWDPTNSPSISFVFSLSPSERREWKSIVEKIIRESAEKLVESVEEEDEAEAETVAPVLTLSSSKPAVAPSPAAKNKLPAVAEEDEDEIVLQEIPESALDPAATTLTLTRKGTDGLLQYAGVDIENLPDDIEAFFAKKKPRIELFEFLSGNLQDSATADSIATREYEFLQGVFFYAGLNPLDAKDLFKQNDRTSRSLDNASKTLDANLRALWGQGTNLHFHLQHRDKAIEFLADDPAIKSRKARMSKRSAGVTQFFRVSMVLHARRKKNPANSYIYLFDEPGVLLHPQGQRDLLQVFEQLASENQIVYATHSLFLLNQNFPERHRLILKDETGTKVDQKPYRQNWKFATDALGVYLTSNILFSNKVLLVEGDSDPMYLYELFRQLIHSEDVDVDLNSLGIMSFYNEQNLRFLLQLFTREAQGALLFVLADGDTAGETMLKRAANLCKVHSVPTSRLFDGRSIEDYCLFEDEFVEAVRQTLRKACEFEGKTVPKDLDAKVQKSWEEHKANIARLDKKERKTTGRWFKDVSAEVISEEASKVVLARTYCQLCREISSPSPNRDRLKEAKTLCNNIATKLALPPVRAKRAIQTNE
jgi:energy-coupling factor transporter ATP-binding protein EcfA2